MNQAGSIASTEGQITNWEQVRADLQEQLVQTRKELKEMIERRYHVARP